MFKSDNKMSELKGLLDSDDELPTTYNEVPETPAYLNDSRFDAIQFSWLNSGQTRRCPRKKETTLTPIKLSPETCEESSTIQALPEIHGEANATTTESISEIYQEETNTIQYLRKTYDKENKKNCSLLQQSNDSRTLMKKGILNEQDILCMKSFAALTSDDATLLWFIDFLIYKDLQSDYKFLRSCLVDHQLNHEGLCKPYMHMSKNSVDCFELVLV